MSKTGSNFNWLETNDLSFRGLSLMEILRRSTIRYDDVYPDTPKVVTEKKLTEKQLFAKLKKELKEVSVKLN
jgi:hypothetical protein